MGKSTGLKAWTLRAALLAVLVSMIPRILQQAPQDQRTLLERTGQVFRKAGYRTELIVDQAWGQRTRAAETTLISRSPLCGADIKVSAVSMANLADNFQTTKVRPSTSYAFGDWAGPQVERVGLLFALVRLRLRSAFSFGRTPWAQTAMLVIEDPSACMAILPPPIVEIWR